MLGGNVGISMFVQWYHNSQGDGAEDEDCVVITVGFGVWIIYYAVQKYEIQKHGNTERLGMQSSTKMKTGNLLSFRKEFRVFA